MYKGIPWQAVFVTYTTICTGAFSSIRPQNKLALDSKAKKTSQPAQTLSNKLNVMNIWNVLALHQEHFEMYSSVYLSISECRFLIYQNNLCDVDPVRFASYSVSDPQYNVNDQNVSD